MSFSDISIILRVYFVSLIWQLMTWPAVSWYFGKLTDKGWAVCRIFSTLIVSLIIWQLGNFGFQVNNNNSVLIISVVLAVISLLVIKKRGLLKKSDLIESAKFIGIEEYLFIVGLTMMTIIRGFAPDIHNLEKFMDFGFINRYLISTKLPAMDMWFATSSINYYSFGHFWASILIRFLGVAPAIGYNLVIAVILAMSLSLTFSIVSNLVNKNDNGKITGGLLAAFLVGIGGNSHTFWYFLSHHFNMDGYWYADATRFIYNTIHEFPGYSFIVSDLHGHLLDLPVVLAFILIFIYWAKHKGTLEEVIMGFLMGVMMMTNTWDLPIYGMLMGIFCLFELFTKRTTIFKVVKTAAMMIVSMIIVAAPWWISFVPISSGIGIVTMRSPLWQLMVLWTGGFIAVLLAAVSAKDQNKWLVWSLGVAAITLIIIPELIYAKDIYPNHPRANTMFKLTYQAFILMGISLGVALGQIMERKRSLLKFLGIFICLVIFVGSMIFPLEGFPSFYGDFKTYKGLDGEKWLKTTAPDKYEVITYLRDHRNDKNMVEAVGDSYTDYNTISVFSGVPTVVGWRVHEWLWRGGYTPVGNRDEEVKNFYEDNDNKKTLDFIRKYNIGWIVVGKEEKEKYALNERKIRKLGTLVLNTDEGYLIEVNGH